MPKTSNILTTKAALMRERRANRRLRALIESLREEMWQTRRVVEMNVTRLAQLQIEIDRLKPQD